MQFWSFSENGIAEYKRPEENQIWNYAAIIVNWDANTVHA